jgi:hypothetical protein
MAELESYKEGRTIEFDFTFYNSDNELVTPSDITYRLDDEDTLEEILPNTPFLDLASTITIPIPPESNLVLNRSLEKEIHVLTIKANYGAPTGITEEIRFYIENLNFSTLID